VRRFPLNLAAYQTVRVSKGETLTNTIQSLFSYPPQVRHGACVGTFERMHVASFESDASYCFAFGHLTFLRSRCAR